MCHQETTHFGYRHAALQLWSSGESTYSPIRDNKCWD